MENHFSHFALESADPWPCSQPFSTQPSEIYPVYTGLFQHSQQFYPNLPAQEYRENILEGEILNLSTDNNLDDSICIRDDHFSDKFDDNFLDFLHENNTKIDDWFEDDDLKGLGNCFEYKENVKEGSWGISMMPRAEKTSKATKKDALIQGWVIIRKLFLRYLGSPIAIAIIRQESTCNQILWETGGRHVCKALRKLAGQISKINMMKNASYDHLNGYERFISGLLQRLLTDFLDEKAGFGVRGLNNVNERVKVTTLEILRVMNEIILRQGN